jgi:hypothetical protein
MVDDHTKDVKEVLHGKAARECPFAGSHPGPPSEASHGEAGTEGGGKPLWRQWTAAEARRVLKARRAVPAGSEAGRGGIRP